MTGDGEAPDPAAPILRQVGRRHQPWFEGRGGGASERGYPGRPPGGRSQRLEPVRLTDRSG
jgi:hypothetical protein